MILRKLKERVWRVGKIFLIWMLARCRVKDRHQALSCPHQGWSMLAHHQLIHHQQLSSHWSRRPAAESSHSQEENAKSNSKDASSSIISARSKKNPNLSRLSRLERDATMRDVRCTSYVQKGGVCITHRAVFEWCTNYQKRRLCWTHGANKTSTPCSINSKKGRISPMANQAYL